MTGGAVLETGRLVLREMADDDLDDVAALLGDPEVMRWYPAPRTRAQAQAWIDRARESYARHGFGLWVVRTRDGAFVGDCGLTVQQVGGRAEVEVGYHLLPAHQGRGLATEAALACRDHAAALGVRRLIAITHPENRPSQRVAERLGLAFEREAEVFGLRQHVYAGVLAG